MGGKPFNPKVKALVISMAKNGEARDVIAQKSGLLTRQVNNVIADARRNGHDIPRPRWKVADTRPRVHVSHDALSRLQPCADARNMTARELAARLIDVIGREGLVDAILDDLTDAKEAQA